MALLLVKKTLYHVVCQQIDRERAGPFFPDNNHYNYYVVCINTCRKRELLARSNWYVIEY